MFRYNTIKSLPGFKENLSSHCSESDDFDKLVKTSYWISSTFKKIKKRTKPVGIRVKEKRKSNEAAPKSPKSVKTVSQGILEQKFRFFRDKFDHILNQRQIVNKQHSDKIAEMERQLQKDREEITKLASGNLEVPNENQA